MTQHRQGNLNENSIAGYARSHKLDEVTIGLSLLCALPGDVIERALLDKNREMLLILAKALDFSWATTMALLFLGAKDHRITAKDLKDLETEYGRLNVETSRSVLKFYQSRKNAGERRFRARSASPRWRFNELRPAEIGAGNIGHERNSFGILRATARLASEETRPENPWTRPGWFSKPPTISATTPPSKFAGG